MSKTVLRLAAIFKNKNLIIWSKMLLSICLEPGTILSLWVKIDLQIWLASRNPSCNKGEKSSQTITVRDVDKHCCLVGKGRPYASFPERRILGSAALLVYTCTSRTISKEPKLAVLQMFRIH